MTSPCGSDSTFFLEVGMGNAKCIQNAVACWLCNMSKSTPILSTRKKECIKPYIFALCIL